MNVKGTVKHILFPSGGKAGENGYVVFKMKVEDGDEVLKDQYLTVNGYAHDLVAEMYVIVDGNIVNHPTYGKQMKADNIQKTTPVTKAGIINVLKTNVAGVGDTTALKIYNAFGKDTLDILEKDANRVTEVGFGKKTTERLRLALQEFFKSATIVTEIEKLGISETYSRRIYQKLGDKAVLRITQNPYILIKEIDGIAFKLADKIAFGLGFAVNSPHRIKEGIKFTLEKAMSDGHVFLQKDELISKSAEILEIDVTDIKNQLAEICKSKDVIADENRYYLDLLYNTEVKIARNISKFIKPATLLPDMEETRKHLKKIEETLKITLENRQREAVISAVRENIMVITGGPGTGKTTIINAIIRLYENELHKKVLLAAPTGRAAKRMFEATKKPAKTIHRLLESGMEDGKLMFKKNELNKLEGDVLILDEVSMVDVFLMNNLLKALPDSMKLILVGDIDQLPSVGPGNILRDIIASEQVKTVRLTEIYRQAMDSMIITNSHKINNGEMPSLKKDSDLQKSDFIFVGSHTAKNIEAAIINIVKNKIINLRGVNIIEDVQILTPMKPGPIGMHNLNTKLQELLNPKNSKKNEIKWDDKVSKEEVTFREQDKVMQIKNNYDKNIFNGDCGVISGIDLDEKVITVKYPEIEGDKYVEYSYEDLTELVLAYAITIHKSQGSECPIIIMPISMSHKTLLQRNLLYTGLTRAKKLAIIIGEDYAIDYCVKNNKIENRNTYLSQRIREYV